MFEQAMQGGFPLFRQQSAPKRSRRAQPRERTYLDDIIELLYPEPIKPPQDEPRGGSDLPEAATVMGSMRLSEVLARLRAERLAQGLSLSNIYDATGITRGRLSRLENGIETNPTIGTLERLAEALGIGLRITFVEGTEPQEC